MIVTVSYEIDFPGLTGEEDSLPFEDMAAQVLQSLLDACEERTWDTGGISTNVYPYATEAYRLDVVKVTMKDGTIHEYRYCIVQEDPTLTRLAADLAQAGVSHEVSRVEVL